MQAQKSRDNSDQSDHSVEEKFEHIDVQQNQPSKTQKSQGDNNQSNHSVGDNFDRKNIQDQSSSTSNDLISTPKTDEDVPSSSASKDNSSPVGSDSEDALLLLLRCYWCVLYSVVCLTCASSSGVNSLMRPKLLYLRKWSTPHPPHYPRSVPHLHPPQSRK